MPAVSDGGILGIETLAPFTLVRYPPLLRTVAVGNLAFLGGLWSNLDMARLRVFHGVAGLSRGIYDGVYGLLSGRPLRRPHFMAAHCMSGLHVDIADFRARSGCHGVLDSCLGSYGSAIRFEEIGGQA